MPRQRITLDKGAAKLLAGFASLTQQSPDAAAGALIRQALTAQEEIAMLNPIMIRALGPWLDEDAGGLQPDLH